MGEDSLEPNRDVEYATTVFAFFCCSIVIVSIIIFPKLHSLSYCLLLSLTTMDAMYALGHVVFYNSPSESTQLCLFQGQYFKS